MGLIDIMSITLDPTTLPALDIIALAQSGQILRAERETAENGIPCFITKQDWNHLKHEMNYKLTDEALLTALEKISARFLQEAARSCSLLKAAPQETDLPNSFEIESDLFTDHRKIFLILVRDMTHPVACALIGTSTTLLDTLRSKN